MTGPTKPAGPPPGIANWIDMLPAGRPLGQLTPETVARLREKALELQEAHERLVVGPEVLTDDWVARTFTLFREYFYIRRELSPPAALQVEAAMAVTESQLAATGLNSLQRYVFANGLFMPAILRDFPGALDSWLYTVRVNDKLLAEAQARHGQVSDEARHTAIAAVIASTLVFLTQMVGTDRLPGWLSPELASKRPVAPDPLLALARDLLNGTADC